MRERCLNLFPAKRNLKEIIKVAVKAFFIPAVILWFEIWGSSAYFQIFCEQPFQSRFMRWHKRISGILSTCSSTSISYHRKILTYTHTSSHFLLFHLLLLLSWIPLELMRILLDKIRFMAFCKAHRISSSRTPCFRIVIQNKSEGFSYVKRERKSSS